MISMIGLMIATYVFTRMAELIQAKDTNSAVKGFAVITLLVSVIGSLVMLFGGGGTVPPGLR